MKKNMEIYDHIYDITEENLARVGKTLCYSKESFLYSAFCDPKYADVAKISTYDNNHFTEILYVALFYRIEELKARLSWESKSQMDPGDYQTNSFTALVGSEEFADKGCILQGAMYSNPRARAKIWTSVGQRAMGRQEDYYVHKLFSLYKKMPKFLRKFLKAIVKRVMK